MAIDFDTVKTVGKRTLDEVKEDNVGLLASAVSFRIFLAFFPAIIAAVAIWGLVSSPQQINQVIDQASGVLPAQAQTTLTNAISNASGGIAIAGVLGGLWAATSAAAVLIKALNAAFEVEDARGFVKQRLVAFVLTIALLLAIAALAVLLILGQQIESWLFPQASGGVQALLTIGRILVSVGILMVLFAFVYSFGPHRPHTPIRWISPGAVLGVVLWLVLSFLFQLYVANWGNYSQTYGSIAAVIITMLWLQLTMMALLLGAEINQVWYRMTGQRREPVAA
jgi:membrane protein